MNLLEGKNIFKTYSRGNSSVQALIDVDFTLGDGEILGIVGESGSGKSTLLKQISGLETPDSGEILLAGPTVMKEYLKHPEETAQTLRKHADGLTWVYTGDLGVMDSEGFTYFRGRSKRMIVSSGYNIYPAQLENIFDSCDLVSMSCCIGVPDSYRMHRVKVFIVPAPGVEPSKETRDAILKYASKRIAKYAMPKDLEFRAELPKTLVGKVAYRVLEEEEAAKQTQPDPVKK